MGPDLGQLLVALSVVAWNRIRVCFVLWNIQGDLPMELMELSGCRDRFPIGSLEAVPIVARTRYTHLIDVNGTSRATGRGRSDTFGGRRLEPVVRNTIVD